jgi:hypothetical protein
MGVLTIQNLQIRCRSRARTEFVCVKIQTDLTRCRSYQFLFRRLWSTKCGKPRYEDGSIDLKCDCFLSILRPFPDPSQLIFIILSNPHTSLDSFSQYRSTRFVDMDLLPLVQEVQTAAEVLSSGDKVAHARLLHAIHKLTLAAETPTQTLMRISFQVCTVPQTSRAMRSYLRCLSKN